MFHIQHSILKATGWVKWLLPFYLLTFLPLNTIAQDARRTKSGIIIIGEGDSVRAVEPFNGTFERGMAYANAANTYYNTFEGRVKVYCMVIPTAVALYCPNEYSMWTKDEYASVKRLFHQLNDSVKAVDLFDIMARHADEEIYSRTDHHWASLGAFYAAQEFARIAGVPFKDLNHYDKHVINNYVGTMYRFSRDAAVKNAPERFTWYVPRGVKYTTTYVKYKLGRDKKTVVSESAPEQGRFFFEYEDGNSAAYMTFMHGDLNTTTVKTSTKNGRRLLILKDSYGNALPGFLFFSFEEIHVVDCRYFTRNMIDYVYRYGISDILFANNAGHAYTAATAESYMRYLEQ